MIFAGLFNDLLRSLIWLVLWGLGWVLECVFQLRVLRFAGGQLRLATELGITPSTPLEKHGPEMDSRLAALFEDYRKRGVRVAWAMTSGSTRAPKRIVYTEARLRGRHINFFEGYARLFSRLGIFRRSFYVMASLREQGSLTGLMLSEKRAPSRLVCLQAPYRIQSDPMILKLADQYGDAALRLWVLTLSQPAMLYATNPSTLVAWLDALDADWTAASRLCREWVENQESFDTRVRFLARTIASSGGLGRIQWVARQASRPALDEMLTGLRVSSSWDGGYVRPFLDRWLKESHSRFIPLYSMSTEVIQTLTCVFEGSVGFVPAAPGVLYEFYSEKDPSRLLLPVDLEVGQEYVMVVSDRFGLRRYDTEDLFECRRMIRGSMPDLHFKRRSGMSFSFTGEKITGLQVEAALKRLRDSLKGDASVETQAPSFSVFPRSGVHPGYELIQVGGTHLAAGEMEQAIDCFERALSIENPEFSSKRSSGRLARTVYRCVSVAEFGKRVSGLASEGAWESQFKFLPLYTREFL